MINANCILSVAIVARNEVGRIQAALLSLFSQKFSNDFEVILVDNDSSDETVAEAKSLISEVPVNCRLRIKDKFFLLVTIVNDSNIPYDVGYVRFKLVDYKRNFLFGKKKLKEMEMEPSNVYYNPRIPPHSSGRLLFVFDKHGFSEQNTLSIKCSEENGRRDLEIEVPGSIME